MLIKVILVSIILVFIYLIVFNNNDKATVNRYFIKSKKLREDEEFKVLQISDYHDFSDIDNLVSIIHQEIPDIIALTGDFVDARRLDIDNSLNLLKKIKNEKWKIYYTPGNHESRIGRKYERLIKKVESNGVSVLVNQSEGYKLDKSEINVVGLMDPSFIRERDDKEILDEEIRGLIDDDKFNLVLSHRPEAFEVYSKYKADLVLTGHAHGGQIRLPLLGGIWSPNQGFFPKYSSGLHRLASSYMLVSRGLGNSLFPLRVNNSPEVTLTTIRGEK